jgi:DNA-binding transcriptional LysR family regulator
LTAAGERFRTVAIGLLDQIADAKAEIGDAPSRNHIRLALPYALATTRLAGWWSAWSPDAVISCSVEVGHVHDAVSALSAGSVDLLICYQHAAHPVPLDPARFDRHELGVEALRPYASHALVGQGRAALPGTAVQPVPLLMYSPSVYFGRVVESMLENSPRKVHGFKALEVEMSDALAALARANLGVAWLPDSTLRREDLEGLAPIGAGEWDAQVSVVAYRAGNNTRRAVGQIWDRLVASAPI